jgi:hypothetical protein
MQWLVMLGKFVVDLPVVEPGGIRAEWGWLASPGGIAR